MPVSSQPPDPDGLDLPELRRPLDAGEATLVDRARRTAFVLYEGRAVPHRSCGVALAETFGLATRPYQALRRGGITGEGECGAIKAGELVLGEILGDPDPAGPVTDTLRRAAPLYRALWRRRTDRGPGGAEGSIVCSKLTAPWEDFSGPGRKAFCTALASEAAGAVAETLLRCGVRPEVAHPPGPAAPPDGGSSP